jgi:rhamnosyl/mannosyltransferase
MNVLHVGKYYPPYMGGIETHLHALCGELRRFMDVRVLVANTDSSSKTECIDGMMVERTGAVCTLASAPLCPGMVSRIRNSDADLIHIHLPNPTAVLAYLASGRKGNLVVTYHSDTVRQTVLGTLFNPIQHRFLRRSQAILATSPDYLESSSVLGEHRARCHVVPYGIGLEDFARSDAAQVSQLRQQYGDRLVLAVGRLVYYKGFEVLIEAMVNVDGRLLLIGDGPLRAKLAGLAAALGIADRVVFLGALQNRETIPFYHAADVFVLPSVARSEAFGIVQIEAMAAGTPVVNTALDSGVPFVSRHEVTGLTVPPQDPAALAAALNRLLQDDQLRAGYGKAARLRAQTHFSLEAMTSQTRAIYTSVLEDSARGGRQTIWQKDPHQFQHAERVPPRY